MVSGLGNPEQPFERGSLTLRALWMTGEAEIRMINPSKSPLKVRLMIDLSKNKITEHKQTFHNIFVVFVLSW